MSELESSRRRSALALLGASVICFSLWDFYLGPYGRGVRVFDLFGAGLLFGGLLLGAVLQLRERCRFAMAQYDAVLLVVALFVVAGVVGSVMQIESIRPTIGVWIGVALFIVAHAIHLPRKGLRRLLEALLVLNITALGMQLAVYHLSGTILNFHGVVGSVPRVLGNIFRPSGLYLEPAIYSLCVLLLLVLRARLTSRFDLLTILALASVLASVSLFGMIAVTAFIGYRFWRAPAFWFVAVVVLVLAFVSHDSWRSLPQVLLVLDRMADLSTDSSVSARYAGLATVRGALWSSPAFWFGRGVTNDYLAFGSSSLGFLIGNIGAIGTALVGLLLIRSAAAGERTFLAFALVLTLVAAPLWTTFFWWTWLGLMTNRSLAPAGVPISPGAARAQEASWQALPAGVIT